MNKLEQFILDNHRVWPCPDQESALIAGSGSATYCITKTDFLERIAEENRPRFEDHRDAKCFACDEDGEWFKNKSTTNVEPREDEVGYRGAWVCEELLVGVEGWEGIQYGNPIGGWKESLMIRPEEKAEAKWVPSVGDVCVTVAGDFTIDYVGKRQVFGHYKLGIENQYRISELVKKEICDKEMFVNKLRESVVGVSCDKDLEDLYDKGFRYMGELYE